MEITAEELEKSYAVVEEWSKRLSEFPIAQELDRGVLRSVFENMGANFEIDPELQKKFHTKNYSNQTRHEAVVAVLGDKYTKFWEFCKTMEPKKGVKFKANEKIDKTAGMRHFLIELTALAATTEEEYFMNDFVTRMTASAVNGRLRERGLTGKNNRMLIRVDRYNTINYSFKGKPGDKREGPLPFAPASFPPEFPKKAWEFMKSWKR